MHELRLTTESDEPANPAQPAELLQPADPPINPPVDPLPASSLELDIEDFFTSIQRHLEACHARSQAQQLAQEQELGNIWRLVERYATSHPDQSSDFQQRLKDLIDQLDPEHRHSYSRWQAISKLSHAEQIEQLWGISADKLFEEYRHEEPFSGRVHRELAFLARDLPRTEAFHRLQSRISERTSREYGTAGQQGVTRDAVLRLGDVQAVRQELKEEMEHGAEAIGNVTMRKGRSRAKGKRKRLYSPIDLYYPRKRLASDEPKAAVEDAGASSPVLLTPPPELALSDTSYGSPEMPRSRGVALADVPDQFLDFATDFLLTPGSRSARSSMKSAAQLDIASVTDRKAGGDVSSSADDDFGNHGNGVESGGGQEDHVHDNPDFHSDTHDASPLASLGPNTSPFQLNLPPVISASEDGQSPKQHVPKQKPPEQRAPEQKAPDPRAREHKVAEQKAPSVNPRDEAEQTSLSGCKSSASGPISVLDRPGTPSNPSATMQESRSNLQQEPISNLPPTDVVGALSSLEHGQLVSGSAIDFVVDMLKPALRHNYMIFSNTVLQPVESRSLKPLMPWIETILIPVSHTNPEHWTLAEIHIPSQRIRHYDSLGPQNSQLHKSAEDRVRDLLSHRGLDAVAWPFCYAPSPGQQNDMDCGIHVLCQLLRIVLGVDEASVAVDCALWRRIFTSWLSRKAIPYECAASPISALSLPEAQLDQLSTTERLDFQSRTFATLARHNERIESRMTSLQIWLTSIRACQRILDTLNTQAEQLATKADGQKLESERCEAVLTSIRSMTSLSEESKASQIDFWTGSQARLASELHEYHKRATSLPDFKAGLAAAKETAGALFQARSAEEVELQTRRSELGRELERMTVYSGYIAHQYGQTGAGPGPEGQTG